MKSSLSLDRSLLAGSASEALLSLVARRAALYLSLTKPRLVLMVLVTVAVGFLLGARGQCPSHDPDCDAGWHGDGGRRRRRTEPVARALCAID